MSAQLKFKFNEPDLILLVSMLNVIPLNAAYA